MRTSECILWAGELSKGLPVMKIRVGGDYRHKGNWRRVSARKRIYEAAHGTAPGPIGTTCGRSLCVAVAHLAPIRELTTHCVNGHEYTPGNTRWRIRRDKGEATPSRECRTCWERSRHLQKAAS